MLVLIQDSVADAAGDLHDVGRGAASSYSVTVTVTARSQW